MPTSVMKLAMTIALLLCASAVSAVEATDYSLAKNWMYAPSGGALPVDVFYLYPTSWQAEPGDGLVCDIDNASMRAGAPAAYSNTATAFEPLANVYAPFYRQADAAATLAMSQAEAEAVVRGIPLTDAVAAFEYYLENHNNGRPFILAGHSQGSNTLLYLMDTYLKKHPEVQERMIASYVVGYSVTKEYLAANPQLSFGTGEGDTGVILSWNTESGQVAGRNPVVLPNAVAINPLTWTTGTEYAGVQYNLGSLVTDANGDKVLVPGFASAQIDPVRGVVVCDNVNSSDYSLGGPFPPGAYHGSDYPFYYANIMMNALLRSSVYLSREQATMYPSATHALADTARAFGRRLPAIFDADARHVEIRTGNDASTSTFSLSEARAPAGCSGGGVSIFASPFGVWGKQDSQGRHYGYELDGSGVALGGVKSLGAFQFGVAAGYTAQRQKMHGFNGRIDADIVHASLFGGGRWGNVFLDAALGYSHAWNKAERHSVFGGFVDWKHTAKFGQGAWAGRVSLGYVGEVGCGIRVIPSLGVDVQHIRSESFAEDGAVAAFRMQSSHWNSVKLPIAVRVDRSFCVGADTALTPFVSAAWIPELNKNKPSICGAFVNIPSAGTFTTEARDPSRSRGRVATGFRADIGSRMSASVEYSFDFSRSLRLHEVAAAFSLGF